MASPLVVIRELPIPFLENVFRVDLGLPRGCHGLVYLPGDHGSVVREAAFAFALRQNGFGTAICNLLTAEEGEEAAVRASGPVDTELMARRLIKAVDFVRHDHDACGLPAGIVGSGVAAAAALRVAELRPFVFDAVVGHHLSITTGASFDSVRAATLFLAGAGDLARIRPMTRIFRALPCPKNFEIVPVGSLDFEDHRSFDIVCERTVAWMRKHLGHAGDPPANVATLRLDRFSARHHAHV